MRFASSLLIGTLMMLSTSAFSARAFDSELPDVSAIPDSPWMLTSRSDEPGADYRIYKRKLPGSSFSAFRLEATLDAPPAIVAEAAQKNVVDPNVTEANMTKTVLRDDGEATVLYSYIEMPLVSDRDLTTRAVRSFDPKTGAHRMEWHATDEGPAPKEGVVRLRKSSGSWVFNPLPDGRTAAVYESHTDIGGSIPAWLLNSLMSDTVTNGIESLRARVEQDQRQLAGESSERSSRAQ